MVSKTIGFFLNWYVLYLPESVVDSLSVGVANDFPKHNVPPKQAIQRVYEHVFFLFKPSGTEDNPFLLNTLKRLLLTNVGGNFSTILIKVDIRQGKYES